MIAFYISGHGFGHASRSLELIRTLVRRRPGEPIRIKTSAPAWLFDGVDGVSYERFDADAGVIQSDSVTVDAVGTMRAAVDFYRDFDTRAGVEAAWLRDARARLVLGDIPPLAHAAAARAGLASIAVGNFTWDWIYEGYEALAPRSSSVLAVIREAYRQCTLALRLPMHGGFATTPRIVDVPFVARRSTRSRTDTRAALGIPSDRPFVLASFSGYGLDVPFDAIATRERMTILASPVAVPAPLAYEDLVAAADVVVSKPGYGIVSECVANDTPLLYTSRGRFVEYELFVAEMPRVLRCRYMPQEDLRTGHWRPHIEALLAQPAPAERPRVDGADVAAEWISTIL